MAQYYYSFDKKSSDSDVTNSSCISYINIICCTSGCSGYQVNMVFAIKKHILNCWSKLHWNMAKDSNSTCPKLERETRHVIFLSRAFQIHHLTFFVTESIFILPLSGLLGPKIQRLEICLKVFILQLSFWGSSWRGRQTGRLGCLE